MAGPYTEPPILTGQTNWAPRASRRNAVLQRRAASSALATSSFNKDAMPTKRGASPETPATAPAQQPHFMAQNSASFQRRDGTTTGFIVDTRNNATPHVGTADVAQHLDRQAPTGPSNTMPWADNNAPAHHAMAHNTAVDLHGQTHNYQSTGGSTIGREYAGTVTHGDVQRKHNPVPSGYQQDKNNKQLYTRLKIDAARQTAEAVQPAAPAPALAPSPRNSGLVGGIDLNQKQIAPSSPSYGFNG